MNDPTDVDPTIGRWFRPSPSPLPETRSMSLIFIAMPTKGAVLNNQIRPTVLAKIAALHLAFPQHTFVAPMIQDYQLLPWMPTTTATWEDWGRHCRTLIERCDEVWVLKYEGWDTSVGVAGEIQHANDLGRRVSYFRCDDELFTSVN